MSGPYREHEPPSPIKEPWWLGPKRWLRAAAAFLAPSTLTVFLFAAAVVPSICAHVAAVYSWHWLAAPAFVAIGGWAASTRTESEEAFGLTVAFAMFVYVGTLVVLGVVSAPPMLKAECVDAVWGPGARRECDFPEQTMTRFEHAGDVWVECRCPR
jgi:hypothetical protein